MTRALRFEGKASRAPRQAATGAKRLPMGARASCIRATIDLLDLSEELDRDVYAFVPDPSHPFGPLREPVDDAPQVGGDIAGDIEGEERPHNGLPSR